MIPYSMNNSVPESFSVADAVKRIEQGLDNINTSAEWLKFLSFQSMFYHYSFCNTVLIFLQNPCASHVAGFTRWKSLGRFVRRGEKSIKIFAPCTYKSEPEGDSTEKPAILKGFRLASVFDIGQTDGDDSTIPVVVRGLSGDGDDLAHLYEEIRGSLEIPVVEAIDMAAKGAMILFIKSSISIHRSLMFRRLKL